MMEGSTLAFLVALILLNKQPLSSDGLTYTQWYMALGRGLPRPCAGFEIGFCGISQAMHLLAVPPEYFLKFWSLVIYVTSYVGVRRLVEDHPVKIVLPVIFLLCSSAYLPFSITEHLTRQYVAGAIIIVGLSQKNLAYTVLSVAVAGLFHSFSFVMLPVAIALWGGVGLPFMLISVVLAIYMNTQGDILNLLSRFFVEISWLGEYLENEFLKSAAYRFNIYWMGFSRNFGYPEVSFRGIAIAFLLFAALARRFEYRNSIIFAAFTMILWYILSANDLFGHRIYHYIREITMIPTCCSIMLVFQMAYDWLRSRREVLMRSSVGSGKIEIDD